MRLPRTCSRCARGSDRAELHGQASGSATAVECESQVHAEVSHEVRDWQKLFLRPSHRRARVVGRERASAARSFPGPCGGTKIEVSHERFNWLKKIESSESTS